MSPGAGWTRRALLALVSDDVVAQLQQLIAQYQQPERVTSATEYKRILGPARRLVKALHDASPDAREALWLAIRPWTHARQLEHLAFDLSMMAHDVWWFAPDGRRPNHRPINWRRRHLEEDVADILEQSGVRLTKGRNGRLAKVLAIVYDAAGEKDPPVDLFPILKRVCDRPARPSMWRGVPPSRRRVKQVQLLAGTSST